MPCRAHSGRCDMANRTPKARKGQGSFPLSRIEFDRRFRARFFDPAFEDKRAAIEELEPIARDAYEKARKSPSPAAAEPVSPIQATRSPPSGSRRATPSRR